MGSTCGGAASAATAPGFPPRGAAAGRRGCWGKRARALSARRSVRSQMSFCSGRLTTKPRSTGRRIETALMSRNSSTSSPTYSRFSLFGLAVQLGTQLQRRASSGASALRGSSAGKRSESAPHASGVAGEPGLDGAAAVVEHHHVLARSRVKGLHCGARAGTGCAPSPTSAARWLSAARGQRRAARCKCGGLRVVQRWEGRSELSLCPPASSLSLDLRLASSKSLPCAQQFGQPCLWAEPWDRDARSSTAARATLLAAATPQVAPPEHRGVHSAASAAFVSRARGSDTVRGPSSRDRGLCTPHGWMPHPDGSAARHGCDSARVGSGHRRLGALRWHGSNKVRRRVAAAYARRQQAPRTVCSLAPQQHTCGTNWGAVKRCVPLVSWRMERRAQARTTTLPLLPCPRKGAEASSCNVSDILFVCGWHHNGDARNAFATRASVRSALRRRCRCAQSGASTALQPPAAPAPAAPRPLA